MWNVFNLDFKATNKCVSNLFGSTAGPHKSQNPTAQTVKEVRLQPEM